jgi:hypothetical protein
MGQAPGGQVTQRKKCALFFLFALFAELILVYPKRRVRVCGLQELGGCLDWWVGPAELSG